MAKLYFYYSAMNAGKSTTLLQSAYNYHERGMQTLIFKPRIDNRDAQGSVRSRIGLESPAQLFDRGDDLLLLTRRMIERSGRIHCVLVDEAQFCSKAQIHQLTEIVDAVVVVERIAQLRYQLLPVLVRYRKCCGTHVCQAAHEPPPVGRKVRRQEDDVQKLGGPALTGGLPGLPPRERKAACITSGRNAPPASPLVA